jgi:hypothetical protein
MVPMMRCTCDLARREAREETLREFYRRLAPARVGWFEVEAWGARQLASRPHSPSLDPDWPGQDGGIDL